MSRREVEEQNPIMKPKERSRLMELLQFNKKEIDRITLSFLPKTHKSNEITTLYEMIRDYPSRGGKGIRGAMCLLWCELFGGRREDALITSTALELFQNWILIHDDIEDDSDLRRGLPTMHRKYGVPLSINAGDALHGKMWELLLENPKKLSSGVSLLVFSEFTRMLNETTEGQQMELCWTVSRNWHIEERDYLLMVTKKSAWYTCIAPCRLGAILSKSFGSDSDGPRGVALDNLLGSIVDFGIDLGISFQIIDDILNLTADQDKYGKEILGDILEGKRTIMLIHLLENCQSKERSDIIESLSKGRKEKSVSDAERILKKMKEYGSIDYARSLATRYSISARLKFDTIVEANRLENSRVLDLTRNLIEYLTKRDY